MLYSLQGSAGDGLSTSSAGWRCNPRGRKEWWWHRVTARASWGELLSLPLFYFVRLNPFSAPSNVNIILVSKPVTVRKQPSKGWRWKVPGVVLKICCLPTFHQQYLAIKLGSPGARMFQFCFSQGVWSSKDYMH